MQTKMKNKPEKQEDEDFTDKLLPFYQKAKQINQFTVFIDEPFINPSYYRSVVNMLLDCSEDDRVVFQINSPGGRWDGLVTLVEAIKMTEASTVAVLMGECASAASIFALHCDEVYVTDNATMLAHQVSYGYGGKGSDVLSHVQHVSKTSEKLLREVYQGFLSQQEINEMLNGKEIYMDSDEIKIRLMRKQDFIQKQIKAMRKQEAKSNPKPKRKPKQPDSEPVTETIA